MADKTNQDKDNSNELKLVHNDLEKEGKTLPQTNMTDRVWNQILKTRESDRVRYEKLFG